MGKAPYCAPHFQIYKPVLCKVVQIVLFIRPGWEERKRHLHVFKSIEGGSQVKILDVEAHVLCAFSAEDTVPHQFQCGEVGCSCRELAGVVDEVASRRDSNAMRVYFLWTELDNYPCVRDCSICLDEEDVSVSHNKNCIGTFLPSFIVPLQYASKVFSKGGLPYLHRGGVDHQFFVTRYFSPRRRLYHGHRQVF